jgi:hypothetical protein
VKREIPVLITLIAGVFCLIGFFVPHPWVRNGYQDLQNWALILVGLTYVLGVANVLRVNVDGIQNRHKDWVYKIVLVAGLVVMVVIGFAAGDGFLDASSQFSWMYRNFYTPMSATMFSLLAFFIASAGFRAFRARNTEAALLLGSAIIVLLGRAPIGRSISDRLPSITEWIVDVPNNAGRRAIIMGAALGGIVTGLRVILGLERSHLGSE